MTRGRIFLKSFGKSGATEMVEFGQQQKTCEKTARRRSLSLLAQWADPAGHIRNRPGKIRPGNSIRRVRLNDLWAEEAL